MSQNRNIAITVIILFTVAAGVMALTIYNVWVGSQYGNAGSSEPPEVAEDNVYLYDEPRSIGDFSLVDEQGETVDESMLRGQWTLAFLGFTHCPDICPTTMATLSKAEKRISDRATEPQFLMISADPERDTPEALSRYVTFFGDDFRGLTGDIETLRSLASDLNATFTHSTDESGNPVVEHSAHLSIISPGGRLAGLIQKPFDADTVADTYEAIQSWQPGKK
ncbi:electron transporter SenC [Halovibrio salipaludis]|uniref:Electron transporter SenC n=1 Tax=Halovibrio salipaludis TaxID=2032626 RepID=A0A2A2FBK1_9GAMM|nr:SCO family protein [Halovibrio salipaludis]PAU81992.1 electron transporter SenC [Halovibrio salipaludis]